MTYDNTGRDSQQTRGQQGDDRLLSLFFVALILVWAGFILLFRNVAESAGLDPEHASAWVLIGAGVMLWIEAMLRAVMPAYRMRIGERVVLGMVFVIVGLSELTEVNLWPLLLVALGIAVLAGFATASQRT
jgi:hypothetical protein